MSTQAEAAAVTHTDEPKKLVSDSNHKHQQRETLHVCLQTVGGALCVTANSTCAENVVKCYSMQ